MTMIPTPPALPAIDPATLTPPQITWFDGATGELTGTYAQALDPIATRAKWQAAYDALINPWQAACAAIIAADAAKTPPVVTQASEFPPTTT